MKQKTKSPDAAEIKAAEPKPKRSGTHVIHQSAIYTLVTASESLGLAKGCLPREIRMRRLRASKRAGRYYILGEWLLEWIKSGETRLAKSE